MSLRGLAAIGVINQSVEQLKLIINQSYFSWWKMLLLLKNRDQIASEIPGGQTTSF